MQFPFIRLSTLFYPHPCQIHTHAHTRTFLPVSFIKAIMPLNTWRHVCIPVAMQLIALLSCELTKHLCNDAINIHSTTTVPNCSLETLFSPPNINSFPRHTPFLIRRKVSCESIREACCPQARELLLTFSFHAEFGKRGARDLSLTVCSSRLHPLLKCALLQD